MSTSSYKVPGSGLEMPRNEKIETNLKERKKQEFYSELREQFGEGRIDAHSKKFTDILLKHVLTHEEIKELDHETKIEWFKRVRRLIIDKLGGYAEAGQQRIVTEEKKKKKEEEQKNEVRRESSNESSDSETVEDYIKSIEEGTALYND
jgi:hypothetical protein